MFNDFVSIMTFLGDLLTALARSFFHPGRCAWKMSSLYEKGWCGRTSDRGSHQLSLGLIIAFMSSLQLKQFGANIYVASLVGVAMVSELGPIMTAIIVAGRSGSAFAAEIGTMKVNEEVDALVTMGFDPTQFLAVPRFWQPWLLSHTHPLFGLFWHRRRFGRGVLGLDLTVYTYIQETMTVISVTSILKSLLKSVVFAVLIAGIVVKGVPGQGRSASGGVGKRLRGASPASFSSW